MPRSRYKIFEGALKKLRKVSATGLDPANDAPTVPEAGTELHTWYTRRQRKIEYTRAADSKPGKKERIALLPFAFEPNDANITLVTISSRSNDPGARSAIFKGGTITDLNWKASVTGAEQRRGFVPAKMIASKPRPTADQPSGKTNSKISGADYKQIKSKSYTFPFGAGATTTERGFGQVKEILIGKINDGVSVSFTPERI